MKKSKTVRKEIIGKRDTFWGGSEKQSALELRWRRAADCSRGGFEPPETHDRKHWTAVYVGSLAVRMTTIGDGGGRNIQYIPRYTGIPDVRKWTSYVKALESYRLTDRQTPPKLYTTPFRWWSIIAKGPGSSISPSASRTCNITKKWVLPDNQKGKCPSCWHKQNNSDWNDMLMNNKKQ